MNVQLWTWAGALKGYTDKVVHMFYYLVWLNLRVRLQQSPHRLIDFGEVIVVPLPVSFGVVWIVFCGHSVRTSGSRAWYRENRSKGLLFPSKVEEK